jgi:gliding motility-associated-like protein
VGYRTVKLLTTHKLMKKIYLCFLLFFIYGSQIAQNQNQQILNKYERLIFELRDFKQVKGQPFNKTVAVDELKRRNIPPSEWKEIIGLSAQWHKAKYGSGGKAHAHDHDHSSNAKIIQNLPAINNPNCPNAGFENGNFTNWTGSTYTLAGASWATAPTWTNGFVSNGSNAPVGDALARHTLTTIPAGNNNPALGALVGYDSLSINPTTGLATIPIVSPFGSGISARLGNANYGAETERLVFPMTVTQANAQYTFQYAIVLHDPVSHAAQEQPQFAINILDQAGNPIGGCAAYSINVTQAATDPTFIYNPSVSYAGPGGFPTTSAVYFKNWTTIGVNLSAYIGQNIQIEFRSYDCSLGGHFGYAYVDAWCGNPTIPINFCGSTSATLVGPAGFVGYQWYGPNNMTPIAGATNDTLIVSNAVIGNVYTLIATAQNGCNVTIAATIVPSTIGIQSVNTVPSCATGSSGSATIVPTGSSLGNYSYSWVSMQTNNQVSTAATATGLSPGQYSVTVSDPACGSADSIITVGISPPLFYTDVQNFCLSPAQVTAPAGTNYIWYNSLGAIIPGANTGTLTVNNPVNNSFYTVVFNNSSGCKDSVKITTTQTVNQINQNTTFCGTTANLCAPAGATNIVWYDANWPYAAIGTSNCISIPNPIASTWQPYYLSYTNPTTGCKDSVEISLTNTPSAIYASSIVPTCLGSSTGSATINMVSGSPAGTYSLTVTGPSTFPNYTNNTAGTTQNLSNLPAGTYNISFSDGQCTATSSFIVDTIFVNVTTSVAPDTICGGQSAVVTFNYGGGAPTQCGVANSGCASTTTQTVGNGTLQNTSTTWPSPYGNWYSNEKYQILYTASDLLASGLTPGKITSIAFNVASIPAGMNTTFLNYRVKIGCTTVGDLDPTGTGFNVPFQTGVNQLVYGPQNYVVTAGWNTHNFSTPWEWDGISNIIVEICYDWVSSSNYTSNAIMNQSNTGYRSFIVYYSDVTVACPQTLANASYMQRPNTRFTTCQSVASPTDFTYSWAPNNGVSGTAPTINLNPATSTIYTVSITSNFGGCVKQDTIPITVINPFTVTMPAPQTYCVNEPSDQITAIISPTGGTGVWSGPGVTNSGNNADGVFNPAAAGVGTWNLTFTAGGGGCVVTNTVQMTVNSSSNGTINPAGPFCITDNSVNLTAVTPGGTFTGPGITNPASGTFDPSIAGAGTATIQYAIGGNCPATGQLNILVNPQPVISINSNLNQGCDPSDISFTANVPAPGNGTSQWNFGDGNIVNTQNIIHTYSDTGQFDVTYVYIDANGCSDTVLNNNMIWIHPQSTAAFAANPNETTIIDPTVQFVNQSINANSFYWQLTPDSSSVLVNPVWNYTDPGTYEVMLIATNQWGCDDTTYNTVIVNPDVALYVPNAFTPIDENGINDMFLPYLSGTDLSSFKMEIYNRWGEQIYATDDITKGWNGRFKNTGEVVQVDVYVWKIYYKNDENKSVSKVGHVTILK